MHFAFGLILHAMHNHLAVMIDHKRGPAQQIGQVRRDFVPRVRFVPSTTMRSHITVLQDNPSALLLQVQKHWSHRPRFHGSTSEYHGRFRRLPPSPSASFGVTRRDGRMMADLLRQVSPSQIRAEEFESFAKQRIEWFASDSECRRAVAGSGKSGDKDLKKEL